MSVSFSYKYLALFTDAGHLITASAELQVGCMTASNQLLHIGEGEGPVNE